MFLFLLPQLATAGGGWPKKKGTGYYKLSQWWVVSDQHFTSSGGIDPNITTGIFNTSLYAEYGITDRVTGILYFPFFSRTYRNNVVSATTGATTINGEAVNSVGDTNMGLKYGLSKSSSPFALSASFILGLPIGEDAGGSDMTLQTGDGEFNQLIQLDLSRSFKLANLPSYASIYSGFNNRTNNFSDEFRYGAEAGVALFDQKFWTILRLDVVESLKNGLTAAEAGESTTLFANNMEFAAFTVEGAYYVNSRFGISAAYGGAFRGEIVLANPSYSVGIFMDIK